MKTTKDQREDYVFLFSLKLTENSQTWSVFFLAYASICLQKDFSDNLAGCQPLGPGPALPEIHLLVYWSKSLHFQQTLMKHTHTCTRMHAHTHTHTHTHTHRCIWMKIMPSKAHKCAHAYLFTNKQYIAPFTAMASTKSDECKNIHVYTQMHPPRHLTNGQCTVFTTHSPFTSIFPLYSRSNPCVI